MLTEFERQAWDRREKAADHKPPMAMKAALDDYEKRENKAIHAIVVIVTEEDDEQLIEYYQAGSLTDFGVEGALMRCIRASQDGI